MFLHLLTTLLMGSTGPSEPTPPRFAPPLISSTSGGLWGNVTDRSRRPLAGVEILIHHPDGRTWRTTTRAHGEFMAGQLPPGSYTVEVVKTGFHPIIRRERRVFSSTWLVLTDLSMGDASMSCVSVIVPHDYYEFPYTTGATFAPAELAGIPLP